MSIPRRIFLDTNVVNFILDHGGFIFEGEEDKTCIGPADQADMEALRLIFITGGRAHWEMAISGVTYAELAATTDEHRRRQLLEWFGELWAHWRDCFDEDGTLNDFRADELAKALEASGTLSVFPDPADRVLLAHAIAYECDAFCTRDRRTILRHVGRSGSLPLEIISPAEWGGRIEKIVGLF